MFLVALLLGMGWLGACGQKLMVLGGSTDFLLMKASRIRDSMQIDRSLLTVRYRFSTAHPSPGGSPVWCDILVQVGERYIKQTDLCLHYDCLIWTAPAASEPLFAAREKAGIRPSNLFSEIVCDRESREMQVICGDFSRMQRKDIHNPFRKSPGGFPRRNRRSAVTPAAKPRPASAVATGPYGMPPRFRWQSVPGN